MARRGDVYCQELNNHTHCIFVLLERFAPSWKCVIIGGNSSVYTPGSWDIVIHDDELLKCTKMEIVN